MSTVGLNFGSITSGTGFDVASTVTAILANSGAVETPWKNQLTALGAQDTALTAIGTSLSALSTSLSALTNFDGVLSAKLGSSSDTGTVALSSANASAIAGSHSITVTRLAQTSTQYSGQITDSSDVLSGSLSITVGSVTKNIPVGSSTNTLQTLAAAINAGAYGVNASVVQDTGGYRLSLVSQTSGTAGQLTVASSLRDATTSTALGFNSGQPGVDATLIVDGLNVTSASNNVTTVIPGVTFQLLAVSANPVQVQITNDQSSVATALNAFVTAYNAVVTDLTTQEGKDATGAAEPLFGSPVLAQLQSQLSAALLGGSASGKINSVSQLGITLGNDGKLTLATDSLQTALDAHFTDIVGFLQNTGSFGQSFSKTLNSLGSTSTNGALYLAKQENSTKEAALNDNITKEDALLATQKSSLTKELNTANQILQSIPSQLTEVDQIYSALSGYNTTTPG